ncbi:MAG: hypothetical protein K8T25_10355 [Planctomycetia bacterium]|nr:hypothetical protein [Planctomycetia bacterium]
MGNYIRIVLNKPLASITPALCTAFETDSLISVEHATGSDFSISEGRYGTALEENGSFEFAQYVSDEPEMLCKLSELADAELRAIAVQTGVVFVSILVADRGRIIRRYCECDGKVDIDEGQLPLWDEQIRDHAWNAADAMVGIGPPTKVSGASQDRVMIFGAPVMAISPQRLYDRLNQEAEQRTINAVQADVRQGNLECTLQDGSIVPINRHDVDKLVQHPFLPSQHLLLLHGRRTVHLPVDVNVAALNEWLK